VALNSCELLGFDWDYDQVIMEHAENSCSNKNGFI
jgi:hypothetical protein